MHLFDLCFRTVRFDRYSPNWPLCPVDPDCPDWALPEDPAPPAEPDCTNGSAMAISGIDTAAKMIE